MNKNWSCVVAAAACTFLGAYSVGVVGGEPKSGEVRTSRLVLEDSAGKEVCVITAGDGAVRVDMTESDGYLEFLKGGGVTVGRVGVEPSGVTLAMNEEGGGVVHVLSADGQCFMGSRPGLGGRQGEVAVEVLANAGVGGRSGVLYASSGGEIGVGVTGRDGISLAMMGVGSGGPTDGEPKLVVGRPGSGMVRALSQGGAARLAVSSGVGGLEMVSKPGGDAELLVATPEAAAALKVSGGKSALAMRAEGGISELWADPRGGRIAVDSKSGLTAAMSAGMLYAGSADASFKVIKGGVDGGVPEVMMNVGGDLESGSMRLMGSEGMVMAMGAHGDLLRFQAGYKGAVPVALQIDKELEVKVKGFAGK